MANTKSAKKAVTNAANKKVRNDVVRDKVRKARLAITKALNAGKKKADIQKLLNVFYKEVDKSAKKSNKVISKNKAARLKSRMTKKIAGKNRSK